MIIGVTGKSGAGKNYFVEHLLNINPKFLHIDIDKVGHMVMARPDVIQQAIEIFGDRIMTDNKVDRKKLAEIVFNSREEHDKLAKITWKHMKDYIDARLQSDYLGFILNWVLLPTTHYFGLCDVTYLVKADEQQRMQGVMKRDGISYDELMLRDSNCPVFDENIFNYIIINNRKKGV